MFLNSRYFCRNSLKLSYFPEASGFPCCLWILPWGANFHKKRYPWYPQFFALGSLCGPAIRRRRQGMASAHTLLPCCCSQTTVRQCPSSRFVHLPKTQIDLNGSMSAGLLSTTEKSPLV